MPTQQVPLMSPTKGVVRAVAREGQPPDTLWNATNALPYDRYGRKRLAQRGGLIRQFPSALDSSFIQGMIEAPNIIYPPNSFDIPVGSVDDLLNPFTFTAPGTTGPYTHSYPSYPAPTEWVWDFTITYTQTATKTGDDPWGSDTEGTVVNMYCPVGATATDVLIFQLSGGGNLGNISPGLAIALDCIVYSGDPSLGQGSWHQFATSAQLLDQPTGDVASATITAACSIRIRMVNSRAYFTLTVDGASTPAVEIDSGINLTLFPQLACQSAVVDPFFGGVGLTDLTQTFTITD